MSNKKVILKNGFYLLFAKIFNMICSAFIGIFIARYLGVDQYGLYTSGLVFISFFITFSDLGIDMYFLREGSRNKKLVNSLYENTIIVKTFMIIIISLLILIVPYFLNYDVEIIKIIRIIFIGQILSIYTNSFYVHMQIFGKLSKAAIFQLVTNMLTVVNVLLTVKFKFSLYTFAIISNIPFIINFLLHLFYSLKLNNFKVNFRSREVKIIDMIKGCYIFGISSTLYIIYYRSDSLMLNSMSGYVQVGLYEAAYKVFNIMLTSMAVLDNIIMPTFFRLYKENKKLLNDYYNKITKYVVILGSAISIGIFAISNDIINILYGKKDFSDSGIILAILSIGLMFRFLTTVRGFIITVSDSMVIKVKLQATFAIVNIILNLILIKYYGAIGAAITTLITEILMCISYGIIAKKKLFKVNNLLEIIKFVIPSLIMGLVIVNLNINIILKILVGMFIIAILNIKNIKELKTLKG